MATDATSGHSARPRYWSIQYLRGIAAIAVVTYHVFDLPIGPVGYHFTIGAHGVDVFFVISGFIMYAVARDEQLCKFLARRLTRIFPLYWLATLLYVGLMIKLMGYRPSGTETTLSLALIPHYSEAHREQIWPILVPGWTLSYELYFYALFALGIAARKVIALPTALILTMIGLGLALQPRNAILVVATDLRLLEFVLGLLLAVAVTSGRPVLGTSAVAAAFLAWAAWLMGADKVMVMAASFAIVTAALAIESGYRAQPIALLRHLGDSSYAIYLFHFPALAVIEYAVRSSGLPADTVARVSIAVFAIMLAVGFGVLIHLVVERPLLRTLNTWIERAIARFGLVLVPGVPAHEESSNG